MCERAVRLGGLAPAAHAACRVGALVAAAGPAGARRTDLSVGAGTGRYPTRIRQLPVDDFLADRVDVLAGQPGCAAGAPAVVGQRTGRGLRAADGFFYRDSRDSRFAGDGLARASCGVLPGLWL